MNLSAWSIRNPLPVAVLFCLLSLAGLLAFQKMNVQQFPEVARPLVTVSASWPGATAAQMDLAVARPLEAAVAAVPGLKHTHTTVQDGTASVTAEFHADKPLQQALDEVRAAVSRARGSLPSDLREPGVAAVNLSSAAPVLAYALTSDVLSPQQLTQMAEENVRKALVAVRGVASVDVVGGANPQLQIEWDPFRLAAAQTSVVEVTRQLREQLAHVPGGKLRAGSVVDPVVASLAVVGAEALGRVEIGLAPGRSARLDQLGSVSLGTAARTSAAYVDGRPVVALQVTRLPAAGDVNVGRAVRAEMASLQKAHPDVRIREVLNAVDPVQENVDGSMWLLYEGAFVAMLVVGLFLANWRATLVSALALPLSIVPTFAAMHVAGFTLNTVTLLSLSLVVGVVVDDAIVEVENIMRHLRMGKSPLQAARDAADEIGMAVIATTLALMAVFVPTAFMSGVASEYFVQFGWTAAFAVLFSLLVARMLTPLMAAYGLRQAAAEPPESAVMRGYLRWLRGCLRHPWLVLLCAAALVALSALAASRLDSGFMPADDGTQTQVTLELPSGSTLERTERAAKQAMSLLGAHPQVQLVYANLGGAGAVSDATSIAEVAEVRTAVLHIQLAARSARVHQTKASIERELGGLLAALAGVRVHIGQPGSRDQHSIMLTGDDEQALALHARQVEREVRAVPGLGPVTSSDLGLSSRWTVQVDSARAAARGVSTAAVGDTLRLATAGDLETPLTHLRLNGAEVPVVARLAGADLNQAQTLQALWVPGTHGPVSLGDVAQVRRSAELSRIDRFDRRRSIVIHVDVGSRTLGDVETELAELASLKRLPQGVRLQDTGDAESMKELFDSFKWAAAAGGTCVLLLLILLFRDPLQPFTVVAAMALAVPGALVALWWSGAPLSMPALIGLLMLAGLTAKNSILLVDYSLTGRRQAGLGSVEAVLEACRKRARPIVMTSVAMAAGMLPTAMGWGVDPSFRAPLAIVVVGGLVTSTLLSLIVVPVLIVGMDAAWAALRKPRLRG